MSRQSAATPPQTWTIVLAAGDGTRLSSLTQALHGEAVPKQFAQIQGRQSLLQTTLDRVQGWSSPERTVVVVAREREAIARVQTRPFGPVDVVAQPRNLGTGPGVLLPLARVMARDPDALVVVVPSDHFVRDAAPFAESVSNAIDVARATGKLVLIGAEPDRPEREYGWIVTRPCSETQTAAVARFEEKPPEAVAQELFVAGALWNTFVMVGSATCLWRLAARHLPVQAAMLEEYAATIDTPDEKHCLSHVYSRMPLADFSRDVLREANGLHAVTLEPCGWSDWGTPERVLDSLRGSRDYDHLVQRLDRGRRLPAPSQSSTWPRAGATTRPPAARSA